jgi:hypothetical protein
MENDEPKVPASTLDGVIGLGASLGEPRPRCVGPCPSSGGSGGSAPLRACTGMSRSVLPQPDFRNASGRLCSRAAARELLSHRLDASARKGRERCDPGRVLGDRDTPWLRGAHVSEPGLIKPHPRLGCDLCAAPAARRGPPEGVDPVDGRCDFSPHARNARAALGEPLERDRRERLRYSAGR